MGIFSAGCLSLEECIQWQGIFSLISQIYTVFGVDPAQLLHVVVKQAGKVYFRFTWSQTKKQDFHILPANIPVFTVKLHLLGQPACVISLLTLQRA